jgi:hypothetical protein
MAAVTRPGPGDARAPCPLCGGLIHPIAGRCKHCKGDLRALRSTRPAAAASLPALNAALPAPAPRAAAPNGHANGHAPAAPAAPHAPASYHADPAAPVSLVQAVAAAAPIPLAIHHGSPGEAAVPILPPRPTGRYAAAPPRASWKSWPVIVIILAVIAIVTAVILMVFPPGGPKDAGTSGPPPPAPDRMDTNPSPSTPTPRQPPSTSPDPWSRGSGAGITPAQPAPTVPTPVTPPGTAPDVDIDDPDLNDPSASRDPFARPRPGRSSTPRMEMLYSIFKHACTRLATCGAVSSQAKQLCDSYNRLPTVSPPSCAAATRCLRNIDEMSCDLAVDDPMKLLQLKDKFTDCTDALSC